MKVKYNVTGTKRKELVLTIAKWLGCEVKYLGAPSFAYEVDYFTIDKDGTLIFDDRADSEVIERLLEMLYDNGFESETLPESENTGLCISMPKSLFTENSMENLKNIIASKESLLKKVFGTAELTVVQEDEEVCFPWFCGNASPEEIRAYEHFICQLCEMARTQKRVVAVERPFVNERYYFRCFLLRLGFIGSEYKEMRKILLQNLEGNSAFKAEKSKEAE